MWDLWARIHPAGQHEETCADPHQHPCLPVSPVLQKLCAEADPQGTHDRPLRCEAFQMQGGHKGRTQRVVQMLIGKSPQGTFYSVSWVGLPRLSIGTWPTSSHICHPLSTILCSQQPLAGLWGPCLVCVMVVSYQCLEGGGRQSGKVWGRSPFGEEVVGRMKVMSALLF
jgi:hypothetical protein